MKLPLRIFVGLVISQTVACGQKNQTPIPAVEKMPNLPPGYVLRDWKKVARDFDAIAFDFNRTGQFLPLPWWDNGKVDYDLTGFAMPAYIGDLRQTPQSNNYDAITCFGAVLGATLAGIDKSDQSGHNWVEMLKIYYSRKNGTNLYLNNPGSKSGQSFWYELLPSLLFYQIFDRYRDTPEMKEQFIAIADRWYQGCVSLGATDKAAPDFDHTSFNFTTGQPFDNPKWKEPDAAAGVAYLEYLAFAETKDKKYLQGANWALQFLDERSVNPFYEILMPYAAYASARMNAEQGTKHQTEKFVNWTFDGSNKRKWGVVVEDWNGTPAHGLMGSVYPTHEYAFTMNSFLAPGVMVPIVRYDDRYARAMGKWVLNVAANSRYFYADAWKPEQQTSWEWASKNDPSFSIAYEGLRKKGIERSRPVEEKTIKGKQAGSLVPEGRRLKAAKIFPDASGQIEQVWKFDLPVGKERTLVAILKPEGGKATMPMEAFTASSPDGPWKKAFSVKPGDKTRKWADFEADGPFWFKLQATSDGPRKPLEIEELYINSQLPISPYASGDPTYLAWGQTDLGLYGSSFVGVLGGLVEPTNVEGILRIDCRATEAFAGPSLPTYLFYNPHAEEKEVRFPVGDKSVDLYDTVQNRVVAQGVRGEAAVKLPGDAAAVIVLCPAGGKIAQKDGRTYCDDVVIDYQN